MSPTFFVVIALVAPVILLIARGKLSTGALPALVFTALTTWVATTFVLDTLVPDASNLGAFLTIFFGVVPWIGIAVAALCATRMRGGFVSACLLGLLGWAVGLFAAFVIGELAISSRYFWDYAWLLAAPSGYAALGAIAAAQAQKRS